MLALVSRPTTKSTRRERSAAASAPAASSWTRAALAAGLFVAVCVVFSPYLGNGFTDFDDDKNLTGNLGFRGLGWTQLRWMFTTFHVAHYQPLSWLSLGIDYTLWGMNPFGYHLTNLLLHATTTVLCFFLILALVRRGSPELSERSLVPAAAFGALFFGLHPLRVESVAWITERRDVLSAPFLILAVLAWLRAVEAGEGAAGAGSTGDASRRRRWLAASLGLYALSLLSKSIGMTLPAVLLLLDVRPLGRLDPRPWRWTAPEARPVLLEKVPYAALSLAVTALAFLAQAGSTSLEETAGYVPAARIMVPAFGLVFPLWKTLLPIGLLPLYPRRAGLDPFEMRFVLAAAALLALVLLVAWAARRRPAIAVTALAYAALLIPVLGFVQIGVQVAADRFAYLPSIPLAVLLAAGAARVWDRERRGSARTAMGTALRVLGVVAIACFAVLSWRQCRAWKDGPTLWDHALGIAPDEPLFHNYRGLAAYRLRDYPLAAEEFREVLRLDPRNGAAHSNLGMTLAAQGAYAEAIQEYGKAQEIGGASAEVHHNWGLALLNLGQTAEAIDQFAESLRIDPKDATTRGYLAKTLAASGRWDEALTVLESGIPYGPARSEATDRVALGSAPQSLARVEAILLQYAQRYPTDPWCRQSLALLRIRQGRLADAAALFSEALARDPRGALTYVNFARLCLQAGLASRAAEITRAGALVAPQEPLFQQNLQLAQSMLAARSGAGTTVPDDARALTLAAAAALEEGRTDEAARMAKAALMLQQGSAEARWIADIARGRAPDPRSLMR